MKTKLIILVLVSLIIVSFSMLLVVNVRVNYLGEMLVRESKDQNDSVKSLSSDYLEEAITNLTTRTSNLEAFLLNNAFDEVAKKLTVLADMVEEVFKSKEEIKYSGSPYPEFASEGVPAMRMLYTKGLNIEDPKIKAIAAKMQTLSDLLVSFYCDGGLDSCAVSFPEGITFITDARANSKLDENGKPINADPRTREWYSGAIEVDGIYYSNVIRDLFSNEPAITASIPVSFDGRVVAVVSADVFLGTLEKWISASLEESGFIFIVNQDGSVIFAPDGQRLISPYFVIEGVDLRDSSDERLGEYVTRAMKGDYSPYLITDYAGKEYILIGSSMQSVGWLLVSAIDKAVALSLIPKLDSTFDAVSARTTAEFYQHIKSTLHIVLLVLIGVFVLSLGQAVFLGNRITKPLNRLTKYIHKLKGGNFVFKMDDIYKTKDEIEVLAKAFEELSKKNQHYIKEVTRVTAEKERIGAELNVATQIQADMLPSIFPPYPNKTEFDVFATMHPAKEVGGDFHDFFLVDDDHLALVIADVSGKGVPAALFMVIAKTLIKNRAQMGGTPSEILFDVNNQLAEGNKTDFFVTVWLAIIDIRTGEGLVSNAGHEHPCLKKKNGKFELIKYRHSPAVAAMENMKFPDHKIKLDPGDKVFVYTDGVVEATNAQNELFGEKRMLEALNSNQDASIRALLSNVNAGINRFTDGVQQFDDITMLCMEFLGSKS